MKQMISILAQYITPYPRWRMLPNVTSMRWWWILRALASGTLIRPAQTTIRLNTSSHHGTSTLEAENLSLILQHRLALMASTLMRQPLLSTTNKAKLGTSLAWPRQASFTSLETIQATTRASKSRCMRTTHPRYIRPSTWDWPKECHQLAITLKKSRRKILLIDYQHVRKALTWRNKISWTTWCRSGISKCKEALKSWTLIRTGRVYISASQRNKERRKKSWFWRTLLACSQASRKSFRILLNRVLSRNKISIIPPGALSLAHYSKTRQASASMCRRNAQPRLCHRLLTLTRTLLQRSLPLVAGATWRFSNRKRCLSQTRLDGATRAQQFELTRVLTRAVVIRFEISWRNNQSCWAVPLKLQKHLTTQGPYWTIRMRKRSSSLACHLRMSSHLLSRHRSRPYHVLIC